LYLVEGILCCHAFAVAKRRGCKDLTPYLFKRWNIQEYKNYQPLVHNFDSKEKNAKLSAELEEIKYAEEKEEDLLKVSKFIENYSQELISTNQEKKDSKIPNFEKKLEGKSHRKTRKAPGGSPDKQNEKKDKKVKKSPPKKQ